MRADEISVEISEATLRRHQLTLDQVAHAIRSSSIDIPGGSVKADAGEIRLRGTGQRYSGEELENVVVAREPGGGRLLLRDIATIVDGFEDIDQYGEFNGEQAMMIQIFAYWQRRRHRNFRSRCRLRRETKNESFPRASTSRCGATRPMNLSDDLEP